VRPGIVVKEKGVFHFSDRTNEAGNFTYVYRVLSSLGKNVLKMTETLWKITLIFAEK
jgi:hypothetical protein